MAKNLSVAEHELVKPGDWGWILAGDFARAKRCIKDIVDIGVVVHGDANPLHNSDPFVPHTAEEMARQRIAYYILNRANGRRLQWCKTEAKLISERFRWKQGVAGRQAKRGNALRDSVIVALTRINRRTPPRAKVSAVMFQLDLMGFSPTRKTVEAHLRAIMTEGQKISPQ
jgi:hypothetical protein